LPAPIPFSIHEIPSDQAYLARFQTR
jgi:hypothetical protein